ncbi:MAG: beta-N-acetylhexosaminidase [Clostridia bacterium]|nr:beta-N-acetylhexosaminidase [Clostridia bacterium]
MDKEYFGAMLDMSRNAVMKPEEVKNYARVLKSFGYNMLMLYTEDTYEVNGEPYFGYMRGRYTKEELKDVDAYCASIGVELIPCIQTLAHLGNIFRWGEYGDINDVNDILLAEDERTYKLIDNIFSTLAECFKTRNVHIGMDEAHMLGLGKYLDLHGMKNRFEILVNHLKKVSEIAAKYGFKPMMWSDMFFRLANHGEYYVGKNAHIPQEVIDITPKEVGLVYWDYYHDKKQPFADMIKAHKQFDNEIWFAGGAWSWTGFASSNFYTLQTMKPAMKACRENGLNKIFLTLWGDNGKECSFYSLLPSLYAVRKFYEGEENMNVIKAGFKEVTGEDFDAMAALDIPNFVGGAKNVFQNLGKNSLYRDLLNNYYDSTLYDEIVKTVPGEYKRHARRLSRLAKNSANYGYIFKSSAALCDMLSVKFSLGYNIRKAYENKDRDGLKRAVDEIKKAEVKLEKFYYAFRELWYKENKPHGFDVQDIRLGGLKMRLRSTRERISDFLDGKIAKIDELDEELLDVYCGKDDPKKPVGCFMWSWNVSVNNI